MGTDTVNKTLSTEFQELQRRIQEIQDLRSIQGILGWDLETIMPKKASPIRANQLSTLTRLTHQRMNDPALKPLLDALKKQSEAKQFDTLQQAVFREFSRDYQRASKIPEALLERFVHLTTQAHSVWVEARSQKKFSVFQPLLAEIVEVNRQLADIVGFEDSPYDALLDEYEPGLTVKQLDPLFADLKPALVNLLQKIQTGCKQPDTAFMNHVYLSEKQMAFSRYILEEMGFDFDAGRLDLSAHPFTSGAGYLDIRLTTRVSETDLFSALSSSMHEGGHGIYEQGIGPDLYRTNLGDGTSLGIHESQSRLWENVIGRNLAFWQHYYPKLQGAFHPQLDQISLDAFYKAINVVQPSLVRVEADEVTYNLHIMVRYEIEKAVIEGQLAIAEIPEAWNAKYQEYLGITPPDDALGCLQDVHWSHGSFGYFPTYTLGNLYSSQFYHQAQQEIPGLEEKIAAGDLLTLKRWLNERIHFVGKSETPEEIVQRVCGETLNSRYFVDYLTQKYQLLYSLK